MDAHWQGRHFIEPNTVTNTSLFHWHEAVTENEHSWNTVTHLGKLTPHIEETTLRETSNCTMGIYNTWSSGPETCEHIQLPVTITVQSGNRTWEWTQS